MDLLELKNIRKRFGQLIVLDGVSISVPSGQSLVILGASGTGKSVLLKHIVGLLKPDGGEVWFDGKRIDQLRDRDLDPIRKQIGFLFQMGALFDSFNVEENIAFPLREHTNKSPSEISDIVEEKLRMVGLPDTRKKMPGELSGGQKKRIALARAIALDPRLILYDEPTTGLDPVRSDVINELILKLQHELKVTSLTVTHDMHSAFKVADRIVMLREGKSVFDGTADALRESSDARIRNFVEGKAGPEDLEGLELASQPGRPVPGVSAVRSDPAVDRSDAPGTESEPRDEAPSEARSEPDAGRARDSSDRKSGGGEAAAKKKRSHRNSQR